MTNKDQNKVSDQPMIKNLTFNDRRKSSSKLESQNNINNSKKGLSIWNFSSLNHMRFSRESNSKKSLGPDLKKKTTKKVTSNPLDMTNKSSKGDFVSVTYEEIGLWPRSFSRVLDRFLKQVFSDVENLVIQEYRFYRYLFLTTVRCLCLLFFVPFLVNFFAKNYLIHPLTEYFWNTKQSEIFLNSYQQKRAFAELKEFEEKLYFESFIPLQTSFGTSKNGKENPALNNNRLTNSSSIVPNSSTLLNDSKESNKVSESHKEPRQAIQKNTESFFVNSISYNPYNSKGIKELAEGQLERNLYKQRLQEKTIEIAMRYNEQSIQAITNLFADLLSFLTLFYLLLNLEIQINITKSFLLEVFFGLDDSKKSLFIFLVTDLLVGYHSSNIWELFFEFLFNHYGLPESQTGIFLLVATLPVLLDVLFKYLIFRHLNRSSPGTVATYHAMIE